MAATVQQATTNANNTPGGNTAPNLTQNPRLKRIVYSKYRELLGSYNDKANAIIETLPAYMVQEDRGFNFEPCRLQQQQVDDGMIYGTPSAPGGIPSQRLPTQQQTYEAPACVQNAMMTKDKKPFTYTPGGIDLSQIKSERMAKRLARNAQAEGATGASQLNRPTQPLSPSGCSPAAASIGAAAMGMPFQVFPTGPPAAPPPPPSMGKQHQNFNVSAGAPPPPPPPSTTTTTLAPPNSSKNGSALTAPSSPNAARKSPTPQRFEPPPMGFRPEIKIPANPMARLKKVAPPVEKNNFWVEEYRKERSNSPMVGEYDSNTQNNNTYGSHENSNNNDDYKKSFTPTMTTPQQPATNNYNNNNNNHNMNNNYQQYASQVQPSYSPPTPQQQSPRPEFRSVAAPQSPSVNVYTQNQTDSSPVQQQQQQQRATESPFKFAQQQSRPMQPTSPLAQQQSHQQQQQQQQQQQSPSSAHATPSAAQAPQQSTAQASAVPWRTQRSPQPPQAYQQQQQQPQQQQHLLQQHPQAIYNNVRSRDVFSPAPETTAPYQGPKPTNVGSLYIAPLAPTVEPQAQHIVRQQMQQQAAAAQRDTGMRQMPQQQQQQQQHQPATARWMSSQPAQKEQPAWARPEENGNVVPSSLQRIKSPEPMQQHQQHQQQQQQQQQQQRYQPPQGSQNFGAQAPTGLRLQINIGSSNPGGPKERIIPIHLEQTPTPTHTPSQPSFGAQGGNAAPSSYVMRSPNQFVDQGYNNYPAALQQQMNAPHIIQQQQQTTNNVGGVKTRIIPIALEGDGTRGPISQAPIVIQNDQRTTPVQSKSFRILQKITDTIDGVENKVAVSAPTSAPIESLINAEPQLQRPQFARQMSAQQARNSPTIEQMRRLQIAQEQLPALNQGNSAAMKQAQTNKYVQQSIYNNEDTPQHYVHPSEQHVPEPKKYTGSAIPSRSFKILQAMTTPENAAEMEDSDSIVDELNDKHNPTVINSNQSQTTTSNINSNCKNCSPNPTPPLTSSSASSLNSEASFSAHTPHPFHTYPPSYAYPWCTPMPNGGEQLPPNWNYPFPIPPPPPQMNGETTPNWHYPYPLPPPMPPKQAGDNTAHPHYPPYPYFYPYYPPPPPHMAHPSPTQTSSSASSIEYDSQSAFDPRSYPYHPNYPYPPYHYPVITTNSQNLNPSSRAISVLPDIIVTPSNDDGPSEFMYQHKIKVDKRETPKRTDSNSRESIHREQREGSVIDMLAKHLNELKNPNEQASTMAETESRQKTVAELKKEFDKKSFPNDINTTKVIANKREDNGETSSSDSSEESSESSESLDDETTKNDSRQLPGLKAIKSVTNVQVYNEREREQELIENDDDNDDYDVTSADGESDIFDEEDEECEVSSMGVELELDECIEENDDDDDVLLEQDYLSVIYEEESEMEKSGDTRTAFRNDISSNSSEATTIDNKKLEREIEENDDDDDVEKNGDEGTVEDSNSVTVRLPLRFSFSRSSNDENIATVEVGNSQIEERRNSISIDEKRSTFSVAKLDLEDEEEIGDDYVNEYEDDCDVSVTISLTPSSRSASLDKNSEPRFIYNMEPLKETSKKIKETDCAADKSSSEDVSVSFSLNMRNKFLDQTINGEMTNNIAGIKNKVEEASIAQGVPMVKAEPVDELDFFAMLRATKMQAQQMKEHSASYWGKSSDKTTDIEAEKLAEVSTGETTTNSVENFVNLDTTVNVQEEENEIEDIWASRDEDNLRSNVAKKTPTLESARNSFWSTVQEAASERCEVEPHEQVEPLEEDFWAVIEKSKAEKQTQYVKENMQVVQYWTTTLKSRQEIMTRPQKAEITIQVVEEIPTPMVEKKLKASKKKADKEKRSSTRKKKKTDKVEVAEEQPKAKEPEIVETKIQDVEMVKETTTVQEDFWSTKTKEKKIHVKEVQENSAVQKDDYWSTLNKRAAESKRLKEEIQDTLVVQEDFWSTKAEEKKIHVKEVQETSAVQGDDHWSTLNKKAAESKRQVGEIQDTLAVQEDFWAALKTKTEEPNMQFEQEVNERSAIQESSSSTVKQTVTLKSENTEAIETEEAELDFWADIEESKSTARVCESLYNADKYPEEPREVDTDEEIDFWAEIEAKNNRSNDDDITFHKAANFWASRDRQNSVDETPYKPLTKTPFHARLPDEPSVDMNTWAAALEAAKGEEPEIIDPTVEEEKMLVVVAEKNHYNAESSDFVAEEEFVVDVCTEIQIADQAKEAEPDFWATLKNDKEADTVTIDTEEREELEMKRNNYRKAMAFFTTSVDEQKEQKVTRGLGERKFITRNKAIDLETDSWDWQAVEAAVQQDMPNSNNANIKIAEPSFNIATCNETVQQEAEEQIFDRNTTPTNFETKLNTYKEIPEEAYQEPLTTKSLPYNNLPDLELTNACEEQKPSVRDRIQAFETGAVDCSENKKPDIKMQSLSVESYSPKSPVSRNSSSQRSESEHEEEDSGVTDMNKQLSETDTESESFPELRKMTSYQRAATHSRLFKLLQDENDEEAEKPLQGCEEQLLADEFQLKPSRRKIVHNVSITRRQNPKAVQNAESMSERRERLSLPLRKKNSIDADNPSTPNSPASPILGQPNNNRVVSDKLVNELVQSLLLKRDSSHLRTLPMEKLQAAAKRVLEEEMDSLENTSVETTPAPTPNSAKADRSYADYYNSWSDATGTVDIVPSKAFRALQDRPKRSPWSVKCPRVLSSKTINRDLTRVTESPEIVSRCSKSPERLIRESSVSKWKKV